jgi:hypothetical protein
MSRTLGVVVFLLVSLGIVGGLHYFLWARLVRDAALPAPFRQLATVLLILLGLALPLLFYIERVARPSTSRWFAWPIYTWMGLFFFLVLLAGGVELVHLAARAVARRPIDPERRLLFRRLAGGAVAAVSAGLGALAIRNAVRPPRLKELSIPLARLPRALDGLRIVQLTDLHLGPTLGRPFLESLVARTNALEPDVVAITGDLIDGTVEQLREMVAPLASLRARRGVFFITGNHEYYWGVDAWLAELGRLGVRVLRNERVEIGDGLDLAGVDDLSAGGHPGHGADLPRALAGRDPSRALVLLAHQPRAVEEAARLGVDLQLSGHTHGGQIWPWGWLVYLQQPFVRGLCSVGATRLYVSCGTGYWGPPMRLGTESELTAITLRTA